MTKEGLKETNYDRWRTHALGEWISSSKQIFVNNWSVGVNRRYFDFYIGGLDFGWNVASAFLLIGFYDDEAYVLGEVYAPELTNGELLSEIHDLLGRYDLDFDDLESVYADAASPDRIEVMCQNGLNCYPSVKDVRAKIDTTRETTIHIDDSCVNLIRELPDYEWKRDKYGNILEEPIKENDHAIDAMCYAIYGVRGALSDNKPSFDASEIYVY